MEQMLSIAQSLLTQPVIAVPIACVALTSLLRVILAAKWPHFEDSPWYKVVLNAAQIIIGIGLVLLCRTTGWANDQSGTPLPWGHAVLAGIVAGFASSWLWGLVKAVVKKKLKLTNNDLAERKSKLDKSV